MAGDWIKMRTDLADDPAVIAIAVEAGIDEFSVVGKLHKLWSWADRHCNADGNGNGNASGVTILWIDRFVGTANFGQAMLDVGWLHELESGVQFPKFDRHNTKTAKERALTAKRQSQFKKKSNAEGNATTVTPSVTNALPTEEKRREEKKVKKTAFAASDVLIPEHLDVPEVRQSLSDWLDYKKRAKNYCYAAPEFVSRIFKKFKTPSDFVDAVDHAIACGYTGVFAPKTGEQQQPKQQMCQVPTDEDLAAWNPYA